MKKRLGYGLAVASMAIGGVLVGSGSASAAHCVEGDSPGFSYFGNDHVQEADHAEGGNPGPHAGTSGASNCRDTTGSPSDRAPGRNG